MTRYDSETNSMFFRFNYAATEALFLRRVDNFVIHFVNALPNGRFIISSKGKARIRRVLCFEALQVNYNLCCWVMLSLGVSLIPFTEAHIHIWWIQSTKQLWNTHPSYCTIQNTGSAKYLFFGKCFKKNTEYFLEFIFLFECTILPVNNGK